ncbi:MAG: hypothetical protein JNK64_17850 [Myxococcales bacterium]|nr:hypothetical protein [Myxococcales bacterium]
MFGPMKEGAVARGHLPHLDARAVEHAPAQRSGPELVHAASGDPRAFAASLRGLSPALRDEAVFAAHQLHGNGFVAAAGLDEHEADRGRDRDQSAPATTEVSEDEQQARRAGATVQAGLGQLRGLVGRLSQHGLDTLAGQIQKIASGADAFTAWLFQHKKTNAEQWGMIAAVAEIIVELIVAVVAIGTAVLTSPAVPAAGAIATSVVAGCVAAVTTLVVNLPALLDVVGAHDAADATRGWTRDNPWFGTTLAAIGAVTVAIVSISALTASAAPEAVSDVGPQVVAWMGQGAQLLTRDALMVGVGIEQTTDGAASAGADALVAARQMVEAKVAALGERVAQVQPVSGVAADALGQVCRYAGRLAGRVGSTELCAALAAVIATIDGVVDVIVAAGAIGAAVGAATAHELLAVAGALKAEASSDAAQAAALAAAAESAAAAGRAADAARFDQAGATVGAIAESAGAAGEAFLDVIGSLA